MTNADELVKAEFAHLSFAAVIELRSDSVSLD